MALTRDDAHRLVDELDVDDVATAVALLRQLAAGVPQRTFRSFDTFDGPPDLAERSSEILRDELGGAAKPTDPDVKKLA